MRQKPAAMVKQQKESAKSRARSKLIAETKKGLKEVVKRHGKPSEHKMPTKKEFTLDGTKFVFAVRKVTKDGTKSKRWVRVVHRKRPKKAVQEGPCKKGEYRRKSGHCAKRPTYKVMRGPCPSGKVQSQKTGRCIKERTLKPCGKGKIRNQKTNRCVNLERKSRKGPQTDRGKKAAATRKIVESRAGKASNMPVGGKWSGMIDGKMQKFVVRMVKNKKRWVRNVNRKKKSTTTKSSGGLQKVQPSKIDPIFSDLGDLPGAPAGLRM